MNAVHLLLSPLVIVVLLCAVTAAADRNEWYGESIVNLHIDNHSALVGQGHTVDELVKMVRDIPVTMIQVSALGANGWATIPTEVAPHVDLGEWDTLAVWKQVADRLGRRFGVYINTRGLKLSQIHPQWTQRDARGAGRGRHGGLDICLRPSPDGSGALETLFLPLVREIASRYEPHALWVDGDHARTWTCYCPNCIAAWRAATGGASPPADSHDPDWSRWLEFQLQRFDDYRRQMAEAIHTVQPQCLYTSNHSWRFRSKDPRTPPPWVDTLSGDLSHGAAVQLTRLSAMQLSAQQGLPYDIMHNIRFVSAARREPISLRRARQFGALTFSAGAVWFLWAPGATIVEPEVQARARACAQFARARKAALGPTESLNATAVLLSETSWRAERIAGREGAYNPTLAENAALSLQVSGRGVDIVNEEMLRSAIHRYSEVVIAGQSTVSDDTLKALLRFADRGGLLLVIGDSLKPAREAAGPVVSGLLGVRRNGVLPGLHRARIDGLRFATQGLMQVRRGMADRVWQTDEGRLLLSANRYGRGTAAYLAATNIEHPDKDLWLARALQAAGDGPMVCQLERSSPRDLVFSLRARGDRVVLHIVDLTSTANGHPIEADSAHRIDETQPLADLPLEMACPQQPLSIAVAPADATVEWEWSDGILRLDLHRFDVHAAVIIETAPVAPWPSLPASTPLPVHQPRGEPLVEDFESLPLGQPPASTRLSARVDDHTSILVTDQTAARGRRSLAFRDHPQATRPFLPYLVMFPRDWRSCAARFGCDLRLETGADVLLEFREVENAREFPVGPSLRLHPDGRLRVAGRAQPVAAFPMGEWFHLEVILRMDGAAGYDVQLQCPGRSVQMARDLPFRSPDFWRCGWVGVSSLARGETVFYLDNIRLEP